MTDKPSSPTDCHLRTVGPGNSTGTIRKHQPAQRELDRDHRSEAESDTAILVPIKSFTWAKTRLRSILNDEDRVMLAQMLALNALDSLVHQASTFAVADDESVISYVRSSGHSAITVPSRGLNTGLRSALEIVASKGFRRALIIHSDIPLIGSITSHLTALAEGRAVITPDRHGDGTNLLGFPLYNQPTLHFGQRSAPEHLRSLRAHGLETSVIMSRYLAFDLDTPDDLTEFLKLELIQPRSPHLAEFLHQTRLTVPSMAARYPSSPVTSNALTNVVTPT